jgi:hypothetical protein
MCFEPMTAIAAIGSQIGTALTGTAAAGAAAGTAAAAGSAAAGVGTAASISTALTTASGLIGAYSAYTNNKAVAEAAEKNAEMTEAASRAAIETGEDESQRQRRAGAIQLGKQKAQMAANGQDVSGENAIEFLDEQKDLIEDDAFTIRENALNQGQSLANQAGNYRAEAASANQAAFFEPLGTVLTTGAKVGSKYAGWAAQEYSGGY